MGSMNVPCLGLMLLLWAVSIPSTRAASDCKYDNATCSCTNDEGTISLKGLSDKQEKYEIKDHNSSQVFYWNPCKKFTVGSITAGGVQEQGEGNDYDIGVPEQANTQLVDNDVVFYMIAADGARSMYVRCICQSGFSLTFEGEKPQTEYQFTLKSDDCCVGGQNPDSGSSGLSIGYIMVIAFCSILVIYLAAGIGIQAGVRKARGREVIPNVSFWAALPGLIRDGFIFTFSCGKRSTYSKI